MEIAQQGGHPLRYDELSKKIIAAYTTGAENKSIGIGHAGSVNAVAFSPDGSVLASASADKTIKIWSMLEGQLQKTLRVDEPQRTYPISFIDNGQKLSFGLLSACIWDMQTNSVKPTYQLRWTDPGYWSFKGNGDRSIDTCRQKTVFVGTGGSIRLWSNLPDGYVKTITNRDFPISISDIVLQLKLLFQGTGNLFSKF